MHFTSCYVLFDIFPQLCDDKQKLANFIFNMYWATCGVYITMYISLVATFLPPSHIWAAVTLVWGQLHMSCHVLLQLLEVMDL